MAGGLGQTLARNTLGRPLAVAGVAAAGDLLLNGGKGLNAAGGLLSEGLFNLVSSANSGTLSEAEDSLASVIGDNWFGRFIGNHGTEATLLSVGAAVTFLGPGPAKGWGIVLLAAGVAMMFMNKQVSKGFNLEATDYKVISASSKYALAERIDPSTFSVSEKPDLGDAFDSTSNELDDPDAMTVDENETLVMSGSGKFGGTLKELEDSLDPETPDLEDNRELNAE